MMTKKEQQPSAISPSVFFWTNEIECYEREFGPWEKRCDKIVKRYMDDRGDTAEAVSKFNILYSNIQTLHPAIYASPPTPNIDRRFDSDDDLGRYGALVLERAASYYVKNDLFDKVMKQATLDRLLPGRGQVWVRYVPVFEEPVQITDDAEGKEDVEGAEQAPTLLSEDVVPDYVHWKDFGHTWARTWQEVRGVWRRVYMTRADCVKRFGEEVGNRIPLDASIKGKTNTEVKSGKVACVYEIWDKAKKVAIWLHKELPDVLDESEDPLGLKDFFPCPEPIYSTICTDNLIPTPDYVQYQDQAMEIDDLTARIALITNAVKVAGVYDSSAQGIDRLLSEAAENKLIPVDGWAKFGDKGLTGVISFFPLQEIVATLTALYEAREVAKRDLYEITGISDIVRGQTSAQETATAQQIKGQFATLRLDNNQKDVARFAKDLVVIMTEIIAKHFSLDTIKQVSGVRLLSAQEKQQIEMQMQLAQQRAALVQQTGAVDNTPPIPEDVLELMDLPTWEEIDQLIRDDTARNFRIDIETDSTIKTDQENEKQARIEFLTAVSSFMAQAANVPPELRDLSMEMLMFGVRGFKISRELETTFEATMRKLRQQEDAPPRPSPEEMAAQAEMQRTQADMQMAQFKAQADQAKAQSDMEMQQMKMAADQQKAQSELQIKQMDAQLKAMDVRMKEMELASRQAEAAKGLNDVRSE